MGLPVFKEKRMHTRKRLTGLLPGKIEDDRKNNFSCRPVDVSPNGLGIVTQHLLQIGTLVYLDLKGEMISLIVTWKQADFSKRDLFRYGLVTENQKFDLESIFIETGCLR